MTLATMVVRSERPGLDRGAAAVEFAVILPLMVTMLFGIIDIGQLFYAQLVINDTARETVRTLALTPADATPTPTDAATATANANAGANSVDWNTSRLTPCGPTSPTASVQLNSVKISYWIPAYIPGLTTFTVSARATMTCLQ